VVCTPVRVFFAPRDVESLLALQQPESEAFMLRMNWKERIFASIGTLLLFMAFIACGVWNYQIAAPYLLGVSVQGEVVEVLKYTSRDGDFHRLLVEFLVGGEAKHRLIGQSNEESHYKIGATVKVLYDPKDPETAVIADFTLLFMGLFLTGLLTLLFLGGSILAFRRSWRSYKAFGQFGGAGRQ
jgi:uncharacterized protein DUF3592